jgi:multidrug transporter EmrE-like cation transporter
MSPSRHLRTRTLFFVLLMVLASSTGDIFLKQGLDRIDVQLNPASLGSAFLQTVASGRIWLGVACVLVSFVFYLLLMSWADYSYVMPVSSFGYALVALLGVLVLGESVTLGRWAGVALICLGVTLVGRTEPRTTRAG